MSEETPDELHPVFDEMTKAEFIAWLEKVDEQVDAVPRAIQQAALEEILRRVRAEQFGHDSESE